MALEMVRPWVRRVVAVAALVLGDIGIARLRGNFQPLALQDQIDGGDFILGPDRIVGNMINGDHELGHDRPSLSERDAGLSPITQARMVPCETLRLTAAADG